MSVAASKLESKWLLMTAVIDQGKVFQWSANGASMAARGSAHEEFLRAEIQDTRLMVIGMLVQSPTPGIPNTHFKRR